MILTKDGVYEIHKKYSHGVYKKEILDLVWTHSLIVEELAVMLADNLKQEHSIEVDRSLLKIGAWVHDVGFYDCFDDNYQEKQKYLWHGLLGYELMKKEGVREEVARFAIVHTGVGIEQSRAVEAGLPKNRKYIPVTLEEEMVTYADCFHSKGHVSFSVYDEIEKQTREKRPDDVSILRRFREKYGVPNIEEIEKKYKIWQDQFNDWAKRTGNE